MTSGFISMTCKACLKMQRCSSASSHHTSFPLDLLTLLTLSFLLLSSFSGPHPNTSHSVPRLLLTRYCFLSFIPPPHSTFTKSLLGYPLCFTSILHCSVIHLSFTSASLVISLPFSFNLSLHFHIQLRPTVHGFAEITYYNPAVL